MASLSPIYGFGATQTVLASSPIVTNLGCDEEPTDNNNEIVISSSDESEESEEDSCGSTTRTSPFSSACTTETEDSTDDDLDTSEQSTTHDDDAEEEECHDMDTDRREPEKDDGKKDGWLQNLNRRARRRIRWSVFDPLTGSLFILASEGCKPPRHTSHTIQNVGVVVTEDDDDMIHLVESGSNALKTPLYLSKTELHPHVRVTMLTDVPFSSSATVPTTTTTTSLTNTQLASKSLLGALPEDVTLVVGLGARPRSWSSSSSKSKNESKSKDECMAWIVGCPSRDGLELIAAAASGEQSHVHVPTQCMILSWPAIRRHVLQRKTPLIIIRTTSIVESMIRDDLKSNETYSRVENGDLYHWLLTCNK